MVITQDRKKNAATRTDMSRLSSRALFMALNRQNDDATIITDIITDTITDEQVKRVLCPVLEMIENGRFDAYPKKRRRRSRLWKQKILQYSL